MNNSSWQHSLLSAVSPGELVLALGPGWVNCADALPWNDNRSLLRYVVYSPHYGGDLFICRFQLSFGGTWWHEGLQVGISGVNHWRLAEDDEQDFSVLEGSLTVEPNTHSYSCKKLGLQKLFPSQA